MVRKKSNLHESEIDILAQVAQVKKAGDFFCSQCEDRGFILVEETEEYSQQCIICECEKDKIWRRSLREAGIPVLFHNKTMDGDWWLTQDANHSELGDLTKKKKQIGQFIRKYIRAIPIFLAGYLFTAKRVPNLFRFNSIILVGGSKSGKSLLAAIIAQETLRRGLSVMMYEWVELQDILLDYKNNEKLNSVAEDFANRDLIVVDGLQRLRDVMPPPLVFQLEKISALRLRTGKPIVFTSNGCHGELKAGNNWSGLIDSCYVVQLPSIEKNGTKL